MSIAKAVELLREREAEERTKRVDRAILSNAVGDLAARAAVAKSRFELAASGEKQWKTAVKLAGVIRDLDAMEAKIRRLPPVEQVTKHQRVLEQIAALTNDAYRSLLAHDAVIAQFGGFVGDPVRLAGAIIATEQRSRPKAKRGSKGSDRSFIADVFDSANARKTNTRKKETRLWVTTDDGEVIVEITGEEKEKLLAAKRMLRRKVARSLVNVSRIKTKSGNAPTLTATLSSDAFDLEGDRFTRSALVEMRDHLAGRLCFLGHKYNPPEDVFGTFTETKLVKRGGLTELDATIRVAVDNPRAMQVYEMIKSGHRHGMSVGVLVQESEASDEKGKVDITSVIGLEASVVGIPANQVSGWTRTAS